MSLAKPAEAVRLGFVQRRCALASFLFLFVQLSIQHTHVHLIVEAHDKRALAAA